MTEMTRAEKIETMSAIQKTANLAYIEGRMEDFSNLMDVHIELRDEVLASGFDDLDNIFEAMKNNDPQILDSRGQWRSDMPTFGGPKPRDTMGVWSWDETRLLVGDGSNDLRIVTRDEWDKE